MTASFVVVEPHADDAFLSLGGHIRQWVKDGARVTIVTSEYTSDGGSVSRLRKRYAEAAEYAAKVGASWLPWSQFDAALETDPSWVLVPLGLHPEHVSCRKDVEARLRHEPRYLHYYLDQPYAQTLKLGPEINKLLLNRSVVSFLKPHASKYNACGIFKTQAKFFHYNTPEKLAAGIELVVR